jgi:octaprenyl-diphosphate synthase
MDIGAVRTLIADDLNTVDRLIEDRLRSDVVLINQLSQYIIHSGGKRLRPVVTLLAARAAGCTTEHMFALAAIIEFIHTATLLHDDVVDESDLRRGRETANHIWGNQASILVGDFLYSRAFQMMVDVGDMRIMNIMAETTNRIAEGEVLQLINAHDAETTETRYLQVIQRKTAKLFEAAAQVGAILNRLPALQESALTRYGLHLGTAFQLVDDVLDYSSDATTLGKNIGDDLAEGKPTLPLIYALQHGSPAQAELIRRAIENGGRENIQEVITTIDTTGAIEYTLRLAREQASAAQMALAEIPGSRYKEALVGLADFAVNRKS